MKQTYWARKVHISGMITLCLALMQHEKLTAQFVIPEPVINTGAYQITDTVYMDPGGDDTQAGTFDQPVRSFAVALSRLPFGEEGVNGGNAYGLVMLKPGFYQTVNGFRQNISQWKQGNTYKHVSLEGMGDVTIGGTSEQFAQNHLIILPGNHIFIKNIRLQYSTGIGILLNRSEQGEGLQNNVLIEHVEVDSVGSFSMLIRRVETVLVRHCRSLYASVPASESLTSPCQWPSGIKFFGSSNCIIHDSEIAYTRGEGLNFHNTQRGEAYRNRIHNNPTNVYNDNSASISLHHNLIYNTIGTDPRYWKTCPGDTGPTWAGAGVLIANEGACDEGNFPVFENCQTRCVFPDEVFPNVDSMFIFNNILVNTGSAFRFWQGVTDIPSVNCVRNVFIFNNTISGTLGTPDANRNAMVNVFYPGYNFLFNSFYGTLENVRIFNNIFTWDTEVYDNMRAVNMSFNTLHPGPLDIELDNNLWVADHNFKGSGDVIRPELIGMVDPENMDINAIMPCDENPDWVMGVNNPFDFMGDDYLSRLRNTPVTNVGALEYDAMCYTNVQEENAPAKKDISVYPNPCRAGGQVFVEDAGTGFYRIVDLWGNTLISGELNGHAISIPEGLRGVYVLHLQTLRTYGVIRILVY